ncbi:MAG: DUF3127 domain-containing protein [Flavobacteriales bacterium]
MNLELQGKIIKLLNKQTGEGRNGAWQKQEFILETTGEQYPKKICCSAWGEKVDTLSRFQLNDEVKVSINIESREYNERWYTDIRAWKIDLVGSGNAVSPTSQKSNTVSPPEFPVAEKQTANASEFLEPDGQDDLPF